MADTGKGKPDVPEKKKGGLLRNLFMLAFLALVVLGLLSFLTFKPQDLTDIKGYRDEPRLLPPAGRNLAAVLENAAANGHGVKISEEEINAYLVRTLKFEQEGMLADKVKARGVWVRLENGVAEVILERQLMDEYPHTISMFLRPEQKKNADGSMTTTVHRSSGQFGRIRVFRGFMYLAKNSFESLAAAYSEELQIVQEMFEQKVKITISEDQLELSPPDS